ncbi:MAG: PASTA domain-containing protein [Elusimicrobia bacterium]|nr:PASTA domain-containing protein [Elusimicrobiota bacterium]MBD3412513.1 PASTA domain-containing protein [Elusimicrobiota bacterium]
MIHIQISSGEPTEGIVLMPDFTDGTIEDAREWAEETSTVIAVVKPDPYSAVPLGQIINQIPEPDTIINESQNIEFTVGISTTIARANRTWEYALPQSAGKRLVIIRQKDELGEHLLYKGTALPGSKLSIPFHHSRNSTIQVFLDDMLVKEEFIP